MAVELRPMNEIEFDAYLERMIPEYAKEGAKATGMPADAALGYAQKQIAQLLPEGRLTSGHHFHTVVDGADESVGILWSAERSEKDPPDLFVYDIVIEEAHRGRGLGSAAMRALEAEAARLDVKAISLHVFATNEGAIHLYERLGYACSDRTEAGLHMTKRLPA